jgi:hypothetical protein
MPIYARRVIEALTVDVSGTLLGKDLKQGGRDMISYANSLHDLRIYGFQSRGSRSSFSWIAPRGRHEPGPGGGRRTRKYHIHPSVMG